MLLGMEKRDLNLFPRGGVLKDKGPYWRIILTRRAVPWLRRLVAGLSPLRLGFDLRPVYLGFLVALRQAFVEVLPLSLVSIVPPLLLTHSFIFDERYVSG